MVPTPSIVSTPPTFPYLAYLAYLAYLSYLSYLAYLAYLALSPNLRRLFAEPPSAFRRTSDGPSPKCDTGFNGCLCKSGCAHF